VGGSCQRGRTRLMKTMRYGGVYNRAWRKKEEMCIKDHQKRIGDDRDEKPANRNLQK
jgi:hypothetical protein